MPIESARKHLQGDAGTTSASPSIPRDRRHARRGDRRRHRGDARRATRCGPASDNDFAIITQDQLFEIYNKIFGAFFLVMIVLSAVGLIVGGVGVIAIMMISVTERTREIGVRKALGATRGTILWQFLVEAVTLTGIGAVIGLVVGSGRRDAHQDADAGGGERPADGDRRGARRERVTGVLFGMLPAARAAKLDPVAALRYE